MGRPPTITRERLLETARRVFAEKGFEATTLADIAAELHVTPAAVLRHVPSKQALFATAMRARHIALPACIVRLQATGGAEDPRVVLRRLAEEFVPFVSSTIAENLAIYMHRRSQTSIVLPFDVRDDDSPPRRGLRIVTYYFRRAAEAGVVRVLVDEGQHVAAGQLLVQLETITIDRQSAEQRAAIDAARANLAKALAGP